MTILTWKEQCGRGARLCSSNSTFRRIWHCESILISWFFFRMSQCKGISFENLQLHQSWSRVSRASIITNGQQSKEKSNWKSQYCLINDVHIFQCFFSKLKWIQFILKLKNVTKELVNSALKNNTFFFFHFSYVTYCCHKFKSECTKTCLLCFQFSTKENLVRFYLLINL